MVSWPSTFPKPQLDYYHISPYETVARTDMESGVARQRQRFTSSPYQIRVRWLMKQKIFLLFERWYFNNAKSGAEWIKMQLTSGAGLKDSEVRFIGTYNANLLSGDIWQIDCLVEARNFGVLAGERIGIIVIDDADADKLVKSINKFNRYINVLKPGELNWTRVVD